MNPAFQPYLTAIFATFIGSLSTLLFLLFNRKAAKRQAEITALVAESERHRREEFERLVADQKALRDAQGLIATTVTMLATKDEVRAPYFEQLQRDSATAGHHPTKPRKDELLVKLTGWTANTAELEELKHIAEAERDNPEVAVALSLSIISTEEKLAIQQTVNQAALLLALMPMALAERQKKDRLIEESIKAGLDGQEKKH
jgi:hypothetical protein